MCSATSWFNFNFMFSSSVLELKALVKMRIYEPHSMIFSRADSCVKLWSFSDVSGTVSFHIFRVYLWSGSAKTDCYVSNTLLCISSSAGRGMESDPLRLVRGVNWSLLLHPLKLGYGEWATGKWHLFMTHGSSDWNERQVYPADDNRCQQSSESHDRLCCGRNQSQDGYYTSCWLCLLKLAEVGLQFFLDEFIVDHPSRFVAVSIIFVV